jgi:hypothetical protein
MANTLKQAIIQPTNSDNSSRVVIQYLEDGTIDNQLVVNYDNLSEPQKIVFDNFILLCENLIVE